MNIGFDVSDLCTARADGTTRYTAELVRRLPSLGALHAWTLFAPSSIPESYNLHPITAAAGSRRGGTTYTLATSPWPAYWTQTRLPIDLYRYKPDVLFMPIQQIPYVRPGRMKTVAVIHDLAVHRYPEQFTYKDWLLLHVFSAYVARKADRIIAVSKSTADDIAAYYGRTDNVHVVHHGVDHRQFRLPSDAERHQSWQELTATYSNIKKPFILFVGQIQPRKNIVRLVEAFEILASKSDDLQLVIAGGHGWLQNPILQRVKQSPARDRIVLTGRVPDELLPALYWHAEVFALPSLYEGFGLPIVEALACGCPVVTSHTSSMPEVAGPAAVLVDPFAAESIATGITEARRRRDILRTAGLERARAFRWDYTATKTLAVLEC